MKLAVAAMASVPTAILLVQFVPQMLALPSPEALKLEIAERKRAEEALQQAVRVSLGLQPFSQRNGCLVLPVNER